MYSYRVNGWKVLSDIEFPQFLKAEDDETAADLTISEDCISDKFDKSRECYTDIDRQVSYFSNSHLYMLIENGKTLRYEVKGNEDRAKLNPYFTGWGMSIAAFERGETAIHCSALATDECAVLISGDSGSGKSTLTAHLLDKGLSFLADDMSVVKKNEKGGMYAYPAFPYRKLCRDVVDARGLDKEKLIYIDEEKDKFLVPSSENFVDHGMPVGALIYLALGSEKVEWQEIKGFDKFRIFVNAMFITRLMGKKAFEPKNAAECMDLAGAARVFVIARPATGDTKTEVCAAVDEILGILSER